MARPTALLFREILDTAQSNLLTLEAITSTTEGEEAPTRVECTAIQRVQKALRQLSTTLKAEVADLG